MAASKPHFGPWAIVTGASSGIGTAFAHALAAQRYNIVLVGRRADALAVVADRLQDDHEIKTRTIIADLSDDGFLKKIRKETDDLDIGLLISNAGGDVMGALLKVELDDLTRMLHLNTRSHLELAHHFGRRFIERAYGGILLVSSTAGLQGTPYLGNYAGAKAYLLNLGSALNYELRDTRIHTTVLLPGPTTTPGLTQRNDIPLDTLPAPQMTAEAVVREGLAALARNKPFVIAGRMNRFMSVFGNLIGKTASRNMWGKLVTGIVPDSLKIS
ncbi:MAG: SDR family NAD(P)-dependent oxidoreductase [Pseudomonadota bacterium]